MNSGAGPLTHYLRYLWIYTISSSKLIHTALGIAFGVLISGQLHCFTHITSQLCQNKKPIVFSQTYSWCLLNHIGRADISSLTDGRLESPRQSFKNCQFARTSRIRVVFITVQLIEVMKSQLYEGHIAINYHLRSTKGSKCNKRTIFAQFSNNFPRFASWTSCWTWGLFQLLHLCT